MTLLAQIWAKVAEEALPPNLKREERIEARRLFYLGAESLRQLQLAAADLTDDNRRNFDNAIRSELNLFRATAGTELEGKV